MSEVITQTKQLDLAHDLAKAAVEQNFANLSQETISATLDALYDTLAVTLGGMNAPGLAEARAAFAVWSGGKASVWGGHGTAPGPFAAILNAGALHALDYDDTDDHVPLHANSVVLPALIADIEENYPTCNGEEFLTALAVGIDGAMRIGRAGGPKAKKGWNYSVISGGIGAVLAIASLRKWDTETTVSALGHQLAQTAGSLQSIIDGSLAKRFQPAMVAKDVLVAASLAAVGIDGPVNVFEGRAGFYSLYQDGQFDRELLLTGAETAHMVPKLSLKPYPSCRFTHAPIDLGLEMHNRGVDPQRVQKITYQVSGQAMNMVGRDFDYRSSNVVDAQFSIGYTTTVGLFRGQVVINDFAEQALRDEEVGKFIIERVVVEPTDEVDFLAMAPAKAIVEFNDGSTEEFITNTVSGSPENRMDEAQLKAKATDCLNHGDSTVTSDELWTAVQKLRTNSLVSELVELLNRPTGKGK